MEDPIVKEVRDTRRRIFEECGADLDRLMERLKAVEPQDRERLVSIGDVLERVPQPTSLD